MQATVKKYQINDIFSFFRPPIINLWLYGTEMVNTEAQVTCYHQCNIRGTVGRVIRDACSHSMVVRSEVLYAQAYVPRIDTTILAPTILIRMK